MNVFSTLKRRKLCGNVGPLLFMGETSGSKLCLATGMCVARGESALLTVPEQLLPQFLGTRLDKVRGRRYDERPLAGQSHDGGAREVLLTATSPSPRGGGGGGGGGVIMR